MSSTNPSTVSLVTNEWPVNRAFRIALGDLYGNIIPFADGMVETPQPAIMAGLDYDTPWTRDAAINTWNGAGLLYPDVAKITLLSVLDRHDGHTRIAGQYWDAIIWVMGAWAYYLYSGDRDFLGLALEATRNTLAYFEDTELDADMTLFRGLACYGDGIAAYPDIYTALDTSAMYAWPAQNPEMRHPVGYGIPMKALSTNCLYYQAYLTAIAMAKELDVPGDSTWVGKAAAVKAAINQHFWMADQGHYRYLVDPFGGCDYQEGLGAAFALLFNIADAAQAAQLLQHQHIAQAGIPCVWPTFPRYRNAVGTSFGRHSGTVWPHIQSFWAHAAKLVSRHDLFTHEFTRLTEYANRDNHFTEIYHPLTGEEYGGLQEDGEAMHIRLWDSCARQTWSATAYLRMVLMGVVGMDFSTEGITFNPSMPPNLTSLALKGLPYRKAFVAITIEGNGLNVAEFLLNGVKCEQPFLPAGAEGEQQVRIILG